MANERDQTAKPEGKVEPAKRMKVERRTFLKALAGVPVPGFFALELIKKRRFDHEKKNRVLKELGLENLNDPVVMNSQTGKKGDLIRMRYYNWTKYFDYDIGLIGQLFTHEFDAINQLLRIGIQSANIARAFEEGITCLMAHRSYIEKRRTGWDPITSKIV